MHPALSNLVLAKNGVGS